MKLTKDRFSTWENINDKDYQKEYDDELIINVYPNERSMDIADYILSLQDDLDRLLIKHDEVREELGNMKDENIRLKKENEMSTIVIRDMIQKMPKDTLYFPPMEDKE